MGAGEGQVAAERPMQGKALSMCMGQVAGGRKNWQVAGRQAEADDITSCHVTTTHIMVNFLPQLGIEMIR